MFRRIDCRKYWKWKRQQERKSKKEGKKVRKRKRKESVTDCIEVEQSEALETVVKVRQPKIKKKKKEASWLSIRPLIKRVPLAELVLNCIKPPIEIREQFLNPRHIDCLQLASLDIDILTPEILKATTSLLSQTHEADQIKDRKRWKPCVSKKQHDETRGHKRTRKKSSRKEIEAKEDSESEEESECKSICSSDSEICLQGIKFTPKDKEEMKKYQTQKDVKGG